ncbi:MAG TPA: hypothetical protein PLD20_22840, partial [Blastocatellia bacterium]|nr:hypothetical protein [Blastocatellia bacterium]
MQTIKRYITTLLIALLTVPGTLAQTPQPATQQEAKQQDVTIIIQQEKVRFTAQKAVAEMRLQIFDQSGQLVYDSGPLAEGELNWALQDGNGGAIKSGLYAYTLSVKEAGAEAARVRRGHFIVDKAKDRDGSTDKLWVTSISGDGVGTELTVARDENIAVAGTRTPADRKGAPERQAGDKAKKELNAAAEANGTPGQLALFTSETDLGDSVISEQNGNIGIGASPLADYRLNVEGSAAFNIGNGGAIALGTPNAETGLTITRGAGRADLRFDGSTFKFLAGPAG